MAATRTKTKTPPAEPTLEPHGTDILAAAEASPSPSPAASTATEPVEAPAEGAAWPQDAPDVAAAPKAAREVEGAHTAVQAPPTGIARPALRRGDTARLCVPWRGLGDAGTLVRLENSDAPGRWWVLAPGERRAAVPASELELVEELAP